MLYRYLLYSYCYNHTGNSRSRYSRVIVNRMDWISLSTKLKNSFFNTILLLCYSQSAHNLQYTKRQLPVPIFKLSHSSDVLFLSSILNCFTKCDARLGLGSWVTLELLLVFRYSWGLPQEYWGVNPRFWRMTQEFVPKRENS